MAQIEPDDVKKIIDTDLTDAVIGTYIDDAYDFADGISITSDLVVKYLTAHLIATHRDRPVKSEEAGGAKVVYEGVFGIGLLSTMYGQMAISMDTTGALSLLANQKKSAFIRAVKTG